MFPTELEVQFPSFLGALISILVWILVAMYGFNKFRIMSQHDDTIYNTYTVRNELSDDDFSQEELQFWFAFSAFDYVYDVETESEILSNEGFEQYIDYSIGLWTQRKSESGFSYELDEELTTHKCNETDKRHLSENLNYIDREEVEEQWSNYLCFDHPEKLALRQGESSSDRKALFIEVYYCSGQNYCKEIEEIEAWKKTIKEFVFLTNTRTYQPNDYGDEMLLEYVDRYTQLDISEKHITYKLQQHEADSEESFLGLGIA